MTIETQLPSQPESPTTSSLDQRLARVVALRQQRLQRELEQEPPHLREHRLAREQVLAELPHLAARISSATAEINDSLAHSGIIINLASMGHQSNAEATYTLMLVGAEDHDPRLLINVDSTGSLRAILCGGATRSLVKTSTVSELDRSGVRELLVALLEASYS